MDGEIQNGMQCGEFEALLADALDGTLSGAVMERFQSHAAACPDCGPMFAGAQSGMTWLRSLLEVEPPRNLVRNILIATSGAEQARAERMKPAVAGQRVPGWLRPALAPLFAVGRQPRFALTFAMAFFSLTMLLNVAGVHVKDVRHLDLRPSSIRKTVVNGYYEQSARVVRYYENIRLFQQFEAQVRELKQATRPEEQRQPEKQQQERKYRDNDTSGQPTNHNYVRELGDDTLASAPAPRPLDPTLTVNRRTA
jgi:hypothetical protein